jgi:phage shock protein C
VALRRNTDDGWLGGVCAGLAPSSGLPAMALRVGFVAVPAGIPIYLALWAVLPDEE